MQSTDLEEIKAALARASISSVYTGKVGSGAGDGGEKKSRATAGPASRTGALVSCGGCDQRSGRCFAQQALATLKTSQIECSILPRRDV
jgi:hypothetical protein